MTPEFLLFAAKFALIANGHLCYAVAEIGNKVGALGQSTVRLMHVLSLVLSCAGYWLIISEFFA